jgi:DNA-binding MarR family transcriptional regulator
MIDGSPSYLLHRLVFALDRGADRLLRTHLAISYQRLLFLAILQHHGTMTQHELAVAMGYSDPAISTMLRELARDSLVQIAPSPTHGRRRLVSLTPRGREVVTAGRRFLDERFAELLRAAGVDGEQYRALTERILRALLANPNKEKS